MLRPCPGCRRHVAGEPACPFCGIALPPRSAAPVIARGQFSRAAVFAGATLAGATLAGCWTHNEPETTPHDDQHFSTPVDHHHDHDHARTGDFTAGAGGTLEGTLTNSAGTPLANMPIQLQPRTGTAAKVVNTDAAGHYVFVDIVPGDYEITWDLGSHRRTGPRHQATRIGAGQRARVDLVFDVPQANNNVPMPYGAPPARRRLV